MWKIIWVVPKDKSAAQKASAEPTNSRTLTREARLTAQLACPSAGRSQRAYSHFGNDDLGGTALQSGVRRAHDGFSSNFPAGEKAVYPHRGSGC